MIELGAPIFTKLAETTRTQLATSIVALVVLVALCFSIGEGLRLTPFPVSTLTIEEDSDRQSSAKASQEVALYKYGPLDVPPQNQKRNKRHIVEFVCAPSGIVRKLPTCIYGSATSRQRMLCLLCSSRVSRAAIRRSLLSLKINEFQG